MPHQYYAHSVEGKPPEEWQPLEEHLRNVPELRRGGQMEPPRPLGVTLLRERGWVKGQTEGRGILKAWEVLGLRDIDLLKVAPVPA